MTSACMIGPNQASIFFKQVDLNLFQKQKKEKLYSPFNMI